MKILAIALPTLAALIGSVTPAAAQNQDRPSWYGREVASTARPIRTVTPEVVERERGRRVGGRQDGWRPQRSLYLDPYGNVTVWAGDPPYWLRPFAGAQDYPTGYQGQVPAQRVYGSQSQRQTPCASSGGPATAGSAIASAPGAFRSGC
jgi:hypothetical protein